MSTAHPPKRVQRRVAKEVPALHVPTGYGHNLLLGHNERLSGKTVHGMPQVHWPCDNAKEGSFRSTYVDDQRPPTESTAIQQRKQMAGTEKG